MRTVIILISLFLSPAVWACTCFGPQNFCETVDTSHVEPDVIVLTTKLSDIHYGMQVKVVQVFGGNANVGDTLMVWGDNGALCRWPTGAWAVGDTSVFALHNSDLTGNWIVNPNYPPNLEQPGDYHISACGLYVLNYSGGMVTGQIDPSTTTMDVSTFASFVDGCFTPVPQGVDEFVLADISVVQQGDQLLVNTGSAVPSGLSLLVYTAAGKLVKQMDVTAPRVTVYSGNLPRAIYLLHFVSDQGTLAKRIAIP